MTGRDAVARDIAGVLTRDTPRPQEDWPEVTARPAPALKDAVVPLDRPLPPLGQYLLGSAIAIETARGGAAVPTIDPKTATGAEAVEFFSQLQHARFPHVAAAHAVVHA